MMSTRLTTVISVFSIAIFWWCDPTMAAAPLAATSEPIGSVITKVTESRAKLSKEELLEGVKAVRSKIEDLSVTFTFNAVQENPSTFFYRLRATIVLKGRKFYKDLEYGRDPAISKKVFGKQFAYNGHRTTVLEKDTGYARVITSRDNAAEVGGDYLQFMMHHPLAEASGDTLDLVPFLQSPNTHVRERLESVGKYTCYVADLMNPKTGKPSVTVWIDVDHAFLPMLRRFLASPEFTKPKMELSIDEIVEVLPGLFLPAKGQKKVFPVPGMAIKSLNHHELLVIGLADDKPQLKVNTGVKDDFFDLWKNLPPGTMLLDQDSGKSETIGGNDYIKAGKLGVDGLKGAQLPIPERNQTPERK